MARRAAAMTVAVVVLGMLAATLSTFSQTRAGSAPAHAWIPQTSHSQRVPTFHLHLTAQELAVRAAARTQARRLVGPQARTGAQVSVPASVTSVPDGSGGLYIAWEDFRDGTSDIYALRVTNSGGIATGWPADGLPVCTAPGNQFFPILLPDGSNGVIVGWGDFRDNEMNGDGYAQRVTSSGTLLWAANGVKGISGPNVLNDIALAGDGSGGFLFVWSGPGATDRDIFAVRFDGTGSLASGWNAAGTVVCAASGDQISPTVAPVGSGGAVIAWQDARDLSGITHVYAQRMDGAGAAQWTPNGIQVDASTLGATDPAACPDGAGGAIFFWGDLDNGGSVIAQRFNGSGAAQWGGGSGVNVGGSMSSSGFDAVADGLGGAIGTWLDSGLGATKLQGQRVDGSGAVQWGAAGTELVSTTTGFPSLGDMVPDGVGGAYFVWVDVAGGGNDDIFAQRVNGSGAIQWAANGLTVCGASDNQFGATAALDGAGGLLVAWVDQRSFDSDIYAQRFNAAGTAQFAANGLAVFQNPGVQIASLTVSNSTGVSVWPVWMGKRNGEYDIRTRLILGAGPSGGDPVDICTAAGHQILGAAIGDGSGGLIVAWTDLRSGGEDIYAQRLDASGAPQWGANGLAICTASGRQENPLMISDNAGGAIIVWNDDRNPNNPDIYAQRVTVGGSPQWGANGLAVCSDPGYQASSVVAPDGAGGAIIAWLDLRGFPTAAIYAQRVNAAGAVQWTGNGVSIASASASTGVTGAVTDGANGAILLLNEQLFDLVTGSPTGNRLSAQRVDGSGAAQWGAAGVPVCDAGGWALFERIVSDGSLGAIVAWSDGRNTVSDIYAQRLNSAGASQWGANGKVICNAAGWQTLGGLTRDNSGDALLTWMDERAGNPDVYAERLDPSGASLWTANGVAVSTAARGQALPSIGEWNGALPYHVYVTWTDNRAGDARYIYEQMLDSNGVPQGTPDGVTSTLLSLVSAEVDLGRVRLTWYASASVVATIYRRTVDTDWTAIGVAPSDGRGMIEFEDQAIEAGARYGYRLGVREAGGETFSSDVWVDVPARAGLALDGLRPNPASRELVVSYALASTAPAMLEMFDLSGRRVHAEVLRGLAPGPHTLRLDGTLPPGGLYFLKLTQEGRTVTRRAVVTP